jgi:hypothetical protein
VRGRLVVHAVEDEAHEVGFEDWFHLDHRPPGYQIVHEDPDQPDNLPWPGWRSHGGGPPV